MNKENLNPEQEQTERINEAVSDYWSNPQDYSFEDFEAMFEDRDPCEFL